MISDLHFASAANKKIEWTFFAPFRSLRSLQSAKNATHSKRQSPQVLHFEEWSNQLIEYFAQKLLRIAQYAV